MKKSFLYMLLAILVITLGACKKKDKENDDNLPEDPKIEELTPTPEITEPEPEVNKPDDDHKGEVRSNLTGLWIPEELANQRPYAIQFNNIKIVSNQWGISQADILYEAMVEGGITRLLGIGNNFTSDKIGSIRSSRHYFVSVADEYDAIYIHYGKTKYAVAKINELGINNLDGESGIGSTVFYRVSSLKSPHNAFTSLEKIKKGIESKKYRTELKENYEPHYKFYEEDTDLSTNTLVNHLDVKFSSNYAPFFEYNDKDKLYYRFQHGEKHIDSNTGEQLAFKNIIIQFVKEWAIDKNDYRTMDITDASGEGYYISNGKMIPITWKKKEATKWMRYYNESGEELTINPGKTYIALFPNGRTKDVIMK